MIVLELRTQGGMNAREHFAVRAKRVKAERHATAWALSRHERPALPCLVLLTGLVMAKGGKNEVKEFTGMWRLKAPAPGPAGVTDKLKEQPT